ncbi:hypothetical protein Y032_0868g2779 [Ancylostoma ceylanicum]|uniref:Uncharacterized protein n=1 Tax=Ancylostoma ceylanicum TaxID=53326 RepID=A0A016WAN9_9BILA|nr:hypothetical protein Y032_0868g2779 [Ancylostoma ceylanicum]
MFDDDDFFGFGGMHRAMHHQFREMDRMMNAMLDPFGMMMGGGMGMIEVGQLLSVSVNQRHVSPVLNDLGQHWATTLLNIPFCIGW